MDGVTLESSDDAEEDRAEWVRWSARLGHVIERSFFVGAWILGALLFFTAAMRQLRLVVPSMAFVLFQSLTPLVYLPMYFVAPLAAWTRRWWLCGVAAALIVVHLASIFPAIGSTATPTWAATRPELRVVAANVYEQNSRSDEAARVLLNRDADVVVLTELSAQFKAALDDARVDDVYPFLQIGPLDDENRTTEAIYSRFPLSNKEYVPFGVQTFKFADIEFDGNTIGVLALHVAGPRHGADEWNVELSDLKLFAESRTTPTLLVGDFNANRWNSPFRDLLDTGLVDAHETQGKGLSFSWPSAMPVMRLDHALVNDSVAVVNVEDFDTPGSDHRAMELTLVTKP